LVKLFNDHFIASKRGRKTGIHLAKIQLTKGEDLKNYIMSFYREVVPISEILDGWLTQLSSMDCSYEDLYFPLLKVKSQNWRRP